MAFTAAVLRLHEFIGHMILPVDQQDKDGQIMLAYFLVTRLLVVHFPKNAFKAEAYGGGIRTGVDNAVFSGPVCVDF